MGISPSRSYYLESFLNYFARLILPFFLKAKLTPNQITLLSGGIGFLGIVCIYLDFPIIGFILILIYSILDLVDGDVARFSGNTSIFGGFIDTLIDKIMEFLLFCLILDFFSKFNLSIYKVFICFFLFSLTQFFMVYMKTYKKNEICDKSTSINSVYLSGYELIKSLMSFFLVGHSTIIIFIPIFFIFDVLEEGLILLLFLLSYTLMYQIYINFKNFR